MASNHTLHHRIRPTVVAAAVAAALMLLAAGGAAAQQAGAADNPHVVVVSGTRQSVASAIDRKKNAATVVDSIVAEDIGEFPDKNVGEALSRVTGVQLSRDFGEGSQVNIRGVEANLNRIEINGLSVLSTNGTAGRGAELRELPAELIKSIDVFKGVTADQTEGGIGGTVSIKTNMPLDFKTRTIVTKLEAERGTNRGGVQPRGSLLLADKFLNGRLGLMANLVYDKVYTQNDYVRNSNWRYFRDWDQSPEKTNTSLNPAAAAVSTQSGCAALAGADKTACERQWYDYSPGVPRYGIWTRDHKRSSAELTAQYKINNGFDVWARYNKNNQDQMLNDRNYTTDFGSIKRFSTSGVAPVYGANGQATNTPSCAEPATGVTPAGMSFVNHVMTEFAAGSCQNVAGEGASYNFDTAARDFALKIKSNYKSAGFNWKNSQWSAEGLVAKTDSYYELHTNLISMAANIPGLKVALDDQGLPKFTFPANYDPADSRTYTRIASQYQPSFTDNTEDQVKLDLKYRPNLPFLKSIWFGGQGRKSTSEQYRWTGYLITGDPNTTADDIVVRSPEVRHEIIYDPLNTTGVLRNNGALVAGSGLTANNTTRYVTAGEMASLVDTIRTNTPGTFLNGYGGLSGYPNGWMAPSFANSAQYFDLSRYNHDLLRESIGSDGKRYPMPPQFAVEERIRAFYVRADFAQELFGVEWDGNVGVRYAGTRTRATGLRSYRSYSLNASSGARVENVLANDIVTFENKYSDVLPSFNLAGWLVPDKLVARIGWGKVMSRPFIDKLTPNVSCIRNSGQSQFGGDGSADDCTAGNPDLQPFRATNKDFSVEWYPSRDSQLSLAFFRKDIRSYIQNDVILPNVDVFGNGERWDVKTSINSQGATTKGWELAGRTALTWLPGAFGGLGLDANYTRMSYDYAAGNELLNPLDNTVLPYPGMSRNSYNVGVWYDLGKWNARLAYNYRDGYYTGNVDANAQLPVYAEKTGYLDAKIQYRVTDNLTISAEGKNLTDEGQFLNSGSTSRRNELAWSGRRYFVGATYKF
ncbi:TonB-dependent receptor [Pseudoduganella flava]|uniref:TonB-dependent receptor n=1 Tax=Pseudoduganella flava TaxID=871742 RepID=A0A562PJ85_9BURK|nr:TonB-dependent receptor [Pseudoduganella flava]QGZ42088.1 TonB-dependent receptor [Pseudoduganella flava]TWI44521.1 TonB-dependent receptor [Pseudoduganella flava]